MKPTLIGQMLYMTSRIKKDPQAQWIFHHAPRSPTKCSAATDGGKAVIFAMLSLRSAHVFGVQALDVPRNGFRGQVFVPSSSSRGGQQFCLACDMGCFYAKPDADADGGQGEEAKRALYLSLLVK